jgi:hypothetical protein
MSIQSGDILLNMKSIETLKGGWLIEVQSVSETEGSDCFLVKAIPEQTVDEDGELVRTRRIGIVLSHKLNTPAAIDSVLFEIRRVDSISQCLKSILQSDWRNCEHWKTIYRTESRKN